MDSEALTQLAKDIKLSNVRNSDGQTSFPTYTGQNGIARLVELPKTQLLVVACDLATSASPSIMVRYQIYPRDTSSRIKGKTVYIKNVLPTTPPEHVKKSLLAAVEFLAGNAQLDMKTVDINLVPFP